MRRGEAVAPVQTAGQPATDAVYFAPNMQGVAFTLERLLWITNKLVNLLQRIRY